MDRTEARAAAMKLIYEWQMGGDGGEETRMGLLEIRPNEKEADFMDALVAGVQEHVSELDALIEQYAANWRIDRIEKVTLAILRLAIYELKYEDLPGGVAIVAGCKNEENAKKFVDFLISQEGQECYADTSIRPVLTSVENTSPNMPPFSEINVAYEDIEYCAQMQPQWQERWMELVTG